MGGTQSGDGGFVEISGKYLVYDGNVDVSAPSGDLGTVLFDPINALVSIIGAGVDTATGAAATLGLVQFGDTPAAEPWDVTPDQLNLINGNIVLQATNDITIADAVNISDVAASFVAQAGRNIVVNAGITTDGVIHLEADSPHSTGAEAADGVGTLTIAANLTSTNSNITLIANDFSFTAGTHRGWVRKRVLGAG